MRHLILTDYKSRKLGQISVLWWIYLTTTIPILTILGVEIAAVYNKCNKRSAKIYRLARDRGKSRETTGYNAVPVCTGDKDYVYMKEDEEDSVVLTGVRESRTMKWKPSQHSLCQG